MCHPGSLGGKIPPRATPASTLGHAVLFSSHISHHPAAFGELLRAEIPSQYLMMGRWTPLEEIDDRMADNLGKMIRQVAPKHFEQLGKTRQDWREEIHDRLKNAKVYQLDPNRKFTPTAGAASRTVASAPA